MKETDAVVTLVVAFLAFAAFLFWFGMAKAATNDRVDLALILAVDHSASVDAMEWKLQMEGYAAAFESEAVQASILNGYRGAIAVTMFRWSDQYVQDSVIEWRKVDSPESIAQLAADIRALAALPAMAGTCVAGALVYAHKRFDELPFKAERMVLDVSGDEGAICYAHPQYPDEIRDLLVYNGVTINGLPIADDSIASASGHYNPNASLETFYRDRVIGGPGAFLIVAKGFADFGQAVHRKLLQEIASLSPLPGARP